MDTFQGIRVNFTTATDRIRMVNPNASTAVPLNAAVRLLTDDPSTPADESLGCVAGDYATVQPGEIVVTRAGMCRHRPRDPRQPGQRRAPS